MQAGSRHHGFIRWASVLFVLLIGFLSTAAFLLNHSRVRDLIAQHLKTRLGIEVSTVRVQLVPTVSIEATDLLARDTLTSEPSLRAANASLSVPLWPFIMKRALMLTLHATEPVVVVRRDTEGRWHLPVIEANAPDDSAESSAYTWMLTEIKLNDGRLRILDANRLEREGIGVHHVQALLKTHPREIDADVTDTEIMFRGTTDDGADLQIAGTLALDRLDRSNGVIKKQFDGTVSFHNWDLGYWLKRMRQSTATNSKAVAWRGKISAGLHLDISANGQGFDAIVSDLTTETGWLAIRGQMMVKDAGTDHPAYNIALSTSPVNSETLLSHVPSSWMPEHMRALIQKHQLAGTIELTSVALRGKLDVLRAPDEWHVVTKFVNGSGRWEDRPVSIRDVSGTVSIAPSRANVLDVSANVNGVHVTSDQLAIVDMEVLPTLDANLIGEGPMDNVMALVEALGEGTEASRVVRTISGATGNFRVAAHLAGPLMPKPSLRLLSVEMSLQDMGARLATLSVVNVNGAFEADSRSLKIKHVAGLFQGMHFQAEGNIGMASPPRVNNLKIDIWSDGRTIQELLARSLPDAGMRIDGQAHSTVSLTGTPSAVQCRGSIDVTQTELSVASALHKKKGVPAFLEWEGTLFDRERITIDRLRLALADGELRAVGHVELDRTPKFHLKLDAESLSLRTLAQLGIDLPLTEGIIRASTSISGEGTNWRSWVPTGWARIDRGVIMSPNLHQNVSELSGRLQFTPGSVLLNDVSFRVGDGDLRVTGMIEHWRSNPRATLMVESSELDVSQFLSKKSSPVDSAGSNVQEWMQSKEATITFVVKQLRYERLVLKTVSGTFTVDHQKAQLNDLRGETPKGVLSGHLAARFGGTDQLDVAADLSVHGIPAQSLLATTDKMEHLRGDLSIDGVIQARIDSHSPWKDTLSTGGDGLVLKVTNGRLHEDPVMTKILTILNLPALLFGRVDFEHRGIPFDSLSARLVGHDGVFSSDDILLDSPLIKVAGAGSANVKDNGLDLALAVSPTAAYSDLIGKMPLFGRLVVGDHSGLTTALFQAKGSLVNPEIAYLPLRSLATGVSGYPRLAIDVLMNAIKLPASALAYANE